MQHTSEEIHDIKYADIYNYIREETDTVNNQIKKAQAKQPVGEW